MASKGRNGVYVKNFNNRLVARLLVNNKYSCMEMSKEIKLSHTAIALIIERLKQKNLIKIVEESEAVERKKGGQHMK